MEMVILFVCFALQIVFILDVSLYKIEYLKSACTKNNLDDEVLI